MMRALILGASKRDAEAYASQHAIADFVWMSPRSMGRAVGLEVDAIYATDRARTDTAYHAMLEAAEPTRVRG